MIQLGRTTHRLAAALAGRLDALIQLSGAAQVWLVDPGATLDFYWAARAAGALAD